MQTPRAGGRAHPLELLDAPDGVALTTTLPPRDSTPEILIVRGFIMNRKPNRRNARRRPLHPMPSTRGNIDIRPRRQFDRLRLILKPQPRRPTQQPNPFPIRLVIPEPRRRRMPK